MGPGKVMRATRASIGLVGRLSGRRASPITLLARSASRWPDRTVVTDDDGRLTLAELHERVRELAGAFHARGIGPGSNVGLLCHQHTGLLEATFAALWVDAQITVMDPRTDAEQLDQLGRRMRLDLLVHDADLTWVVTRAGLRVTTLVSDANGSGSVADARSFGHPAPPRRRAARTISASLDDHDLAATLTEIVVGRPVVLSRTPGA